LEASINLVVVELVFPIPVDYLYAIGAFVIVVVVDFVAVVDS
jgi:hypothetical protein